MPRYHLRQTPGADIFDPPLTPCPLSFFLDRPYPRSRYSTQCRPEMDLAQPGDAPPTSTNTAGTLEDSSSTAKRRWRRNRIACDSCHSRRVRCDRAFPCSRCLRSEIRCEFTRERRKRGRIARSKQTATVPNGGSMEKLPKAPNVQPPVPAAVPADAAPTPLPNHASPTTSFQHRSPATNEIDRKSVV